MPAMHFSRLLPIRQDTTLAKFPYWTCRFMQSSPSKMLETHNSVPICRQSFGIAPKTLQIPEAWPGWILR
jgi:hypothetical protein